MREERRHPFISKRDNEHAYCITMQSISAAVGARAPEWSGRKKCCKCVNVERAKKMSMNGKCAYLNFSVQSGEFFECCDLCGKANAPKNDAAGGKRFDATV